MSDIPSSLQRIQIEGARSLSPVSESLIQTLGASINALIDRLPVINIATFTSNGNWTCPTGITSALVVGFGGGGGGGGGGFNGTNGWVGAGGGSGPLSVRQFTVVPANIYTVLIGAGGAGVSGAAGNVGNGSSFNGVLYYGGTGGASFITTPDASTHISGETGGASSISPGGAAGGGDSGGSAGAANSGSGGGGGGSTTGGTTSGGAGGSGLMQVIWISY